MKPVFPATEREAKASISERVRRSPQMVEVAKGLIFEMAKTQEFSDHLIASVLTTHRVWPPGELIIHKLVDSIPGIRSVAESFSWKIACAEAIRSLIQSGHLQALDSHLIQLSFNVMAFYGFPGSGGNKGGIFFDELGASVPNRVRRGQFISTHEPLLSEPDLYLQNIAIANIDQSVRVALDEAVSCFRQDLFNSAAAMLGSASEGSWIDFGTSLIATIPPADQASVQAQIADFRNSRNGVMKRIDAVVAIYKNQKLSSQIASTSGIDPARLDGVRAWSDTIRDSRNTIHVGYRPTTPNTYDKVAELLLATPSNLRALYAIKATADASPAQSAAP
jgi:hypothetical protein